MYYRPWPPTPRHPPPSVPPCPPPSDSSVYRPFGTHIPPPPFGFGSTVMHPFPMTPPQWRPYIPSNLPSLQHSSVSEMSVPESHHRDVPNSHIINQWTSWLTVKEPQVLMRRKSMSKSGLTLPEIRARLLRWKELIEVIQDKQFKSCHSDPSSTEMELSRLQTELAQLQTECSDPELINWVRQKLHRVARKRVSPT
ncbi:unnamed protein product [Echinostoma caproni]|uniref:Protein DYAD-like n=1 Tax=Echinostoma caproni TaxID=27848 RepID=A0A183ATF2_9TREM|nr:unnamed protein product [Echinostoma caproni]